MRFFDLVVGGQGFGTYIIDSTSSDTIDLNGHTWTLNASSGQTVKFGAKLTNSSPSTLNSGLTVTGGGTVDLSNQTMIAGVPDASGSVDTSAQLNIGLLSIDGSKVILPGSTDTRIYGTYFGADSDGTTSYSSISLSNSGTLYLNDGSNIGVNTSGSSYPTQSIVPIAFTGAGNTIQVASDSVAYMHPQFTDSGHGFNITVPSDSFLYLYGNTGGSLTGTVAVSGGGNLNVYGDKTGYATGNDYTSTSFTLNSTTMYAAADTSAKSFNDVILNGTSMLYGHGSFGNVTMNNTSVISPEFKGAQVMNMTGLTVTGGTYQVTYDGTALSQINVSSGSVDFSAGAFTLVLDEADTYTAGQTYMGTILTVPTGQTITAPSSSLTVDTTGYYHIDGTAASSGDITTSLVGSGTATLSLTVNILTDLYTQSALNDLTSSDVSIPSALFDSASLINAVSNSGSASNMKDVSADNFRFTNAILSTGNARPNSGSALESILRATSVNGPVAIERNQIRFWMSPYISRARVDSTIDAVGHQGWTGGSLIGIEHRNSRNTMTWGAFTGATLSKYHENSNPDTFMQTRSLIMGLFNAMKYTDYKDSGNFGHELLISRIKGSNTMQRRDTTNSVISLAEGNNSTTTDLGNAQLNYIWNMMKNVSARISAGVTYTNESNEQYAERNSPNNMIFGATRSKTAEFYMGPGLRHTWNDGVHTWRLTGVYEYGIPFYTKGSGQTIASLTTSSVTVAAAEGEVNKHYIQLNGSYFNSDSGVKLILGYSGTLYKNTRVHTLSAKAEWRF